MGLLASLRVGVVVHLIVVAELVIQGVRFLVWCLHLWFGWEVAAVVSFLAVRICSGFPVIILVRNTGYTKLDSGIPVALLCCRQKLAWQVVVPLWWKRVLELPYLLYQEKDFWKSVDRLLLDLKELD